MHTALAGRVDIVATMPQDLSPTPMNAKPAQRIAKVPSPPRMRANLRTAIDLIVSQGITQRDAARRAGMNETALGRALKKPHIQAFIEQQKALFVSDAEAMRPAYRALALRHAAYLALNAESEAVQARMVEFLAREPDKPASVNVAVQNNIAVKSGAYEFAPPGAKVVEVTPPADQTAPDTVSGDDGAQGADNAG